MAEASETPSDSKKRPFGQETCIKGDIKRSRASPAGAVVSLNVGGRRFEVTRDALCAQPSSMLARMFDPESRFGTPTLDAQGRVFIDRCPEMFCHVLSFLRAGRLIPPVSNQQRLEGYGDSAKVLSCVGVDLPVLNRLSAEAEYFCLDGLLACIREIIVGKPVRELHRAGFSVGKWPGAMHICSHMGLRAYARKTKHAYIHTYTPARVRVLVCAVRNAGSTPAAAPWRARRSQ